MRAEVFDDMGEDDGELDEFFGEGDFFWGLEGGWVGFVL